MIFRSMSIPKPARAPTKGRVVGGVAETLNALRFPSNSSTSCRMKLLGSDLLPFAPATYIWEVTPVQQTGYYTTFFWGNDSGSFSASEMYAGFHPYPQGGTPSLGTDHKWEISANGSDVVTDDNANNTDVTKGVKYLQAARVEVVGSDYVMKFYWNLPDTSKVITYTFDTGFYGAAPTPVLTIGGNAWAPNTENLSGDYQRCKFFDAALTLSDIEDEAADMTQLVTASGISNIWFGKNNWVSNTDLTCDYGTGHSLVWADDGNKATLVSV